MKRFFFALLIMLVLGCSQEPAEPTGDTIDWVADYHQGIKASVEKKKAAMLFFTADWCPPCVELKKHVFSDPNVVAASKALVNISIDVDANRNIMQEYRVRGIPAIFFFTPQDRKLKKFRGLRSAKNFVKHMNAAARAAGSSGE
jgi:thiol:disulfide interchange protein DsbD